MVPENGNVWPVLWHQSGIAHGVIGCFFDRFHKNGSPLP